MKENVRNFETLIDILRMLGTRGSYRIGSGKQSPRSASCLDRCDEHNQCSLICATKTEVGVQVK